MYLFFLYGAGRMDLDGGNSFLGTFEGVGPEIETFLGPEMATSAASAIWAQKNGPRYEQEH
jgi:hypothetical protein